MFLYLLILVFVDFINAAPTVLEYVKDEDNDEYSVGAELGDYFEGDILLTVAQRDAITSAQEYRNGLRGGTKRWPNQTVVYYIHEDDFDVEELEMIKAGMDDVANKSCMKFRQKEDDEHAVLIKGSGKGCFSNVGYSAADDSGKRRQVLNLARGCFKHGTVVHEILHTIGFYHMQSTYDRDEFVKIVWENIREGTEHNFAKYTSDTVTDFGVAYDYGSVMHYPETAFSKNGDKTIIPLQENVKVGQRNGLSESDIVKLNKMYCDVTKEVPSN